MLEKRDDGALTPESPRTPQAFSEEDERQLAKLHAALSENEGFELFLIDVEEGWTRDEVLRRLASWSGRAGVPVLEVVELQPDTPVLSSLGEHDAGAVVLGLDRLVAEADSAADAIGELNWFRDELRNMVPGPLLLVVNRSTHSALFDRAPDLNSWRRRPVIIEGVIAPPGGPGIRGKFHAVGARREHLLAMLDKLKERRVAPHVHMEAWLRLAEFEADLNNAAGAEKALNAAAALLVDATPPELALRARLVAAQVAIARDDCDGAATLLELAEKQHGSLPPRADRMLQGRLMMVHGYLARRRNAHFAAVTWFDLAAMAFSRSKDQESRTIMEIEALVSLWQARDDTGRRLQQVLGLLAHLQSEDRFAHLLALASACVPGTSAADRHLLGEALFECAAEATDQRLLAVARVLRRQLIG
ncbi:MAG: hypothetical protein IPI49_13695 [Myxococcales bacterium]|nr:hypothetical protein [Myxococcales bacterium]